MSGVGGHDEGDGRDEGEEGEVFEQAGNAERTDGDYGEEGARDCRKENDVYEEYLYKRAEGEAFAFIGFWEFENGFPVFGGIEMAEALFFEGVWRPVFEFRWMHWELVWFTNRKPMLLPG